MTLSQREFKELNSSLSEALCDTRTTFVINSTYTVKDALRTLQELSDSYSLNLTNSQIEMVVADLYLMYK